MSSQITEGWAGQPVGGSLPVVNLISYAIAGLGLANHRHNVPLPGALSNGEICFHC